MEQKVIMRDAVEISNLGIKRKSGGYTDRYTLFCHRNKKERCTFDCPLCNLVSFKLNDSSKRIPILEISCGCQPIYFEILEEEEEEENN